MEDNNSFFEDELSTEVSKDGKILVVLATKIEKERWQVAILNEYGISTNWLKYFSTAQLAIETAITAIDEEGMEPFMDTEDFECLFEESV